MSDVFFKDVNMTPPGGLFFYETHGEKVTARTFLEIRPKIRSLMDKYRIGGMVESELARYMCPKMSDPSRYCSGETFSGNGHVRPLEAISESIPYGKRDVVSFDVIERRMQKCQTCPMHARDWCPSCSGHMEKIYESFSGRRTALPVDRSSGVCQCAKAYEASIASVTYGPDDRIWDGAPKSCWRNDDV